LGLEKASALELQWLCGRESEVDEPELRSAVSFSVMEIRREPHSS
jgi:hypothetical protein